MTTVESKFNIGDEVVWSPPRLPTPKIVGKITRITISKHGVLYEVEYTNINGLLMTFLAHSNELTSNLTPDTIDWSHVNPDFKWMARDKIGTSYIFKWMARDESGTAYLFDSCLPPHIVGDMWDSNEGNCVDAGYFSSYKQGTVDWKDSLVQRPEGI